MLDRLNIELHRLAKSVESSQDLVAKDNSLDTAIRASLLLDKILSSTEATVRALLTDDLRYQIANGKTSKAERIVPLMRHVLMFENYGFQVEVNEATKTFSVRANF